VYTKRLYALMRVKHMSLNIQSLHIGWGAHPTDANITSQGYSIATLQTLG
jgi:hypothetical protein